MIVKNLLVVGVVAGFASAAAAEEGKGNFKVGAAIRMDNEQTVTEETDVGAAKVTSKSSKVYLKNAQFTLTGTHGADTLFVKYYAHTNYLRTATITHKFSDMIAVSFGHQQLLAQSFETDYSSNDVYLYSLANGYATHDHAGAKLTLSFGDHSIALQALQGDETITTDANGNEATFKSTGGLTTAIQYRGNINNMIRPLITYTMVNTAGSKGVGTVKNAKGENEVAYYNYGSGYQTQIGAGVQVDVADALIDLEYDTVKLHKQKSSEEKDQNVQSIIAQVKYSIGSTTPFLKLTSDSHKLGADGGIGDKTRMAYAVGVEHKLDETCRIHALYMSKDLKTKATGGDNKEVITGFNLGVTAKM